MEKSLSMDDLLDDIPDASEAGKMTENRRRIIDEMIRKNILEAKIMMKSKMDRQEKKMDIPIVRMRPEFPIRVDPKILIDGVESFFLKKNYWTKQKIDSNNNLILEIAWP